MNKVQHEIKDAIHEFIRVDSFEREVVDSEPLQRLRHINQLSLSNLVYPGATHRRFEHSLGVMELASRVYDSITTEDKLSDRKIRDLLPDASNPTRRNYWRSILRMAALCHDIGHLPFSHALEKRLLPEKWGHERLTYELILSKEMEQYWKEIKLFPEDIARIAVGPSKAATCGDEKPFSTWEAILSEIITGDAFGVDRMDYLLRDAHHTGMHSVQFDHYRIIDTLRIVLPPGDAEAGLDSSEPALGIELGGLSAAEALLLSRYFMYTQVYLHPVCTIYNIHLGDFVSELRDGECFPIDVKEHLLLTDNEIIVEMLKASKDSSAKGHLHADRILNRKHFKVLYSWDPEDSGRNPDATKCIFDAAVGEYGKELVRLDFKKKNRAKSDDFRILKNDVSVGMASSWSKILPNLPNVQPENVFISRDKFDAARDWLRKNKSSIIKLGS